MNLTEYFKEKRRKKIALLVICFIFYIYFAIVIRQFILSPVDLNKWLVVIILLLENVFSVLAGLLIYNLMIETDEEKEYIEGLKI